MKTNRAKHSTLKELFFPERDEQALPARVARFTSVFWVAHTFCSETNKHWKGVTFALKHDRKMPAPFIWSQVEKDAQKEAMQGHEIEGRARETSSRHQAQG